MLEQLEKYVNNLKKWFLSLKKVISVDLTKVLGLGNKKLDQYFDIINPKVGFWEVREKLKTIKEKDSDSHKKFILVLGEKDKNGKPKYENIIDDVYRRIENRNKNIDESEKAEAKNLLEEVKLNSTNVFKNLIEELQNEENKDKKISGFRISTLIKILRGDSFCFNTKEDRNPRYIQFDKEYTSKKVGEKILQYENSQEGEKHILISRRHVDKGADLDKMKECLLKYKKIISYYFTEAKPYVASETWLNDTKFFEYYSKHLSEDESKKKKTIKNLNLTKELSIGDIELLPLVEEGKTDEEYKKRRKDFVEDGGTSLSVALKEYEESGNRLQEGDTVLDLRKLS